jgi:ABC-type Co2+ transport system permease subunit
MKIEKILIALILVIAAIQAFIDVPMVAGIYTSGFVILLVGLVYGFMNPIADIQERTVYLLVAFAAPTVANSLDLIPVAGTYVNAIIDGIALGVGGIWIANFCLSIFNRIKP